MPYCASACEKAAVNPTAARNELLKLSSLLYIHTLTADHPL